MDIHGQPLEFRHQFRILSFSGRQIVHLFECCWSSMHCDVCLEYISLRSLECYPVWIIPGGLFIVQFSAGLWDHHTFDLPWSSPFFVCFELDFLSVLQPGRHHMFRNMWSTILMNEFISFKCLIVLFDNLLMHILWLYFAFRCWCSFFSFAWSVFSFFSWCVLLYRHALLWYT